MGHPFVLSKYINKSERLEHMWVRVDRFIIVYTSSGRTDGGAFWYKGAVCERKVFQRTAHQSH